MSWSINGEAGDKPERTEVWSDDNDEEEEEEMGLVEEVEVVEEDGWMIVMAK